MNPIEQKHSEKREFFRLNFSTPLQYKTCDSQKEILPLSRGTTENLSQSGILFHTSNQPPGISSIVWLSLDIRTLKICQEIESRALIFNNGLLGRVVRVEEVPDKRDSFDVGVCFLTNEERNTRQVQEILSQIISTDSL